MELRTRTFVVVINGAAGCGKDTFMSLCHKYCNDYESANVQLLSAIDPVKDLLRGLGWDGSTKTDEVRDMLANMKQFWVDHQDGPTLYLITSILNFHQIHMKEDNIVFCCIREPADIDKLMRILQPMDIFGVHGTTLKIDRDVTVTANNKSDNIDAINSFPYDHCISNNGTVKQLEEQAHKYIDWLLK